MNGAFNRRYIPTSVKWMLLRLTSYMSIKQLSEASGVSKPTLYRIQHLWDTTRTVARVSIDIGRPRILSPLDVQYIQGLLDHTPDMTSDELRLALEHGRGVSVSRATIDRTCARIDYSCKQLTRSALEANEDLKAEFVTLIGNEGYEPRHLVFVDETKVNKITPRRRMGRSPVGFRASRRDYFVRGRSYTVMAALSFQEMLHIDAVVGAANGALFNIFIEGLLEVMNPWPQDNSVLVMDNASIHKTAAIRELVEAKGCRLIYLPPYSPELNPIEEAFFSIKACIRRHRDEVLAAMDTSDAAFYDLLWDIAFSVTPNMIAGWYRHSGYAT